MTQFVKAITTVLFLMCIIFSNAQSKVLTLQEFINKVKQNHPIAKQANLLIEKAKAEILIAKGEFDPTINLEASSKTLDDKNYYYYTNPELKVPLPIGNIKAGVENNGGDRMSSELTPGKSSYFGVEIPLAKGLIIDKRRAALQQAKIYQKQSEQEKLIVLNNLLFDAYLSYVQWFTVYNQYNVYNNFVNISSNRLRLVKIAVANGDRSPMDTLEAFIQLQNFQMQLADAGLKLINARLDVSNYLWNEKDSAVNVDENTNPQQIDINDVLNIDNTVNTALLQSPLIKYYNFKIDGLNVERKLKKQNLLPYINAKANLLNKDYAVFNGLNAAAFQNNNKLGIDFKFPLFLREGRGELQKTNIKLRDANLELVNKKQQITTKVLSYYNEYIQIKNQLQLAQTLQNNYNTLYRNEVLKFNNGESSLFVVNSRESKLLEAQQKIIELQYKLQKAKYAIEWASCSLR